MHLLSLVGNTIKHDHRKKIFLCVSIIRVIVFPQFIIISYLLFILSFANIFFLLQQHFIFAAILSFTSIFYLLYQYFLFGFILLFEIIFLLCRYFLYNFYSIVCKHILFFQRSQLSYVQETFSQFHQIHFL